MKRSITCTICFVIMSFLFWFLNENTYVNALGTQSPPEVVTSGFFGSGETPSDQISYVIYSDGMMELTGTGATFSCGWDGGAQPFLEYRDQVRCLIIGEGITQIGKGSFAFLSNLETVVFPSSLKVMRNNCFMGSFVDTVTSFTVPASVTQIGGFIVGKAQGSGAAINEIIIENPNVKLNPSSTPLNGPGKITDLRLYSYGSENAVSTYAQAIGCNYVNLDVYFVGCSAELDYELNGTVLTLSPAADNVSITGSNQPWLDHIQAADITDLIVGEGFAAIEDHAFAGYTCLSKVTIGEGVRKLGDRAFAVANGSNLDIKLPHTLQTMGSEIFSGWGSVQASVYYGTASADLCEPNVRLNIVRRMNLLLIGNSYTHDAVNFSFDADDSQLLNMLRSMLGPYAEITISAAYSSAATMAWHATQAEKGIVEYSIYSIGTSNSQWTFDGYMSADQVLCWKDWDAVVLQPYGNESIDGINEPIRPGEEAEKFGTLEAASEYMLDYVAQRAPDAQIYYYMIWRRTRNLKLNAGIELYTPMSLFTPGVMDYEGPVTGRRFADVIPAGTAVQFARSTYFALLSHNPDAYLQGTPAQKDDPQIGLQRDTGHVTFCIGRFIVSRVLAETIIPDQMRVDGYILPNIRDSESIGRLPEAYTDLANIVVNSALESWRRSENKLEITGIEGYDTDPVFLGRDALQSQIFHLTGRMEASVVSASISEEIRAFLGEDFRVEQVILPNPMLLLPDVLYSAEIQLRFGYGLVTTQISFTLEQAVYEATIVPPTCTEKGYTRYTFSDGRTEVGTYVEPAGHTYLDGVCQSCGVQLYELRPNADGTYDYYVGGLKMSAFTGFFEYRSVCWYVDKGNVRLDYKGLVIVDGVRYYIYNGYRSDFTGLKKMGGIWFYFSNGSVDTDYVGLISHNGILVYVENGQVNFQKTDIISYNDERYYIRYGLLANTFSGLVKGSDGIWRYVEDGVFSESFCGLAKNSIGWWYVRDGLVDGSFTGLASNFMGLWYVKNGCADTNYTGLVKHEGDYWYVRHGRPIADYTGIVSYNGCLYYVRNGKADFTYTGTFTDAKGKTYHVVKGVAVYA